MLKRLFMVTVLCTLFKCMSSMAHTQNTIEKLPIAYQRMLGNTDDTYVMFTTDRVNVRTQPNTDSDIIVTYDENIEVDCIGSIDGWTLVMIGDGTDCFYFIKTDFLANEKSYSQQEYEELAHMINAEMEGVSYLNKLYCGSVILNRVNDPRFPNTIHDVLFQKGQYSSIWNGRFNKTPNEDSYKSAKWLLDNGSLLPASVVWQSGIKQGNGIYEVLEGVYYCY